MTMKTQHPRKYGRETLVYTGKDRKKFSLFRDKIYRNPYSFKEFGLSAIYRDEKDKPISANFIFYYVDSIVKMNYFLRDFSVTIISPTRKIARERKSQLRELIEEVN